MATDYSQERIAAMTDELVRAVSVLGVQLDDDRLAHSPPSPGEEAALDLVVSLLSVSSRWSADSGARASGPFGAFLVGLASGSDTALITDRGVRAAESAVDDIIARLRRQE